MANLFKLIALFLVICVAFTECQKKDVKPSTLQPDTKSDDIHNKTDSKGLSWPWPWKPKTTKPPSPTEPASEPTELPTTKYPPTTSSPNETFHIKVVANLFIKRWFFH